MEVGEYSPHSAESPNWGGHGESSLRMGSPDGIVQHWRPRTCNYKTYLIATESPDLPGGAGHGGHRREVEQHHEQTAQDTSTSKGTRSRVHDVDDWKVARVLADDVLDIVDAEAF